MAGTDRLSVFETWPLLTSLFLLIINDFVLKSVYPGLLTGKLSDFAGIMLVSIVLFGFLPRYPFAVGLFIIAGFTFWKSSFSQQLIDLVNESDVIAIGRVVDLTDLFALSVLPMAFAVVRHRGSLRISRHLAKMVRVPAIALTALAISATSPAQDYARYEFRRTAASATFEISAVRRIFDSWAEDNDWGAGRSNPNGSITYANYQSSLTFTINENARSVHVFVHTMRRDPFVFGESRKQLIQRIRHDLSAAFSQLAGDIALVVQEENGS